VQYIAVVLDAVVLDVQREVDQSVEEVQRLLSQQYELQSFFKAFFLYFLCGS